MPEQTSAAQSLRGYLAVVRRQWWVILLVVTACCAAAAIFTARQDPVYEASTKIVVGQGRALFGPDVSFAVEPFTQTMTELLQSDVVADRVIRELDLDITSTQLLSDLEVTSKPDTSVLEVTYQDTDRRMAVRTLAEVAATFTELVDRELAGQSTGDQGTGANAAPQPEPVSAVVFDPARLEPEQVAPRPLRTMAVAILVGLIAGLALAFLRDALASRIRNQDEAEAALGAPVVGALPRGGVGAKPIELELLSTKAAVRVRQAVDMMSATLRFSLKGEDFSVVLVTSAMPEEGKTTVAANLSHGLAQAGRRVVAVEADTRRPALHAFLGAAPDEPGLLDVARGNASVNDVLLDVPLHSPLLAGQEAENGGGVTAVQAPPTSSGQLLLLPAGTRDGGAPPILSLGQTAAIIADLREVADCIVFDSAPVLLAGDAFPLAQLADRVLVVCRERASSRQQAERLRARLQSIGVEDFSVVLTESSAATEPGYGYGYGYGHEYEPEKQREQLTELA